MGSRKTQAFCGRNPPVSKSAFNHRLRKLVELSKR